MTEVKKQRAGRSKSGVMLSKLTQSDQDLEPVCSTVIAVYLRTMPGKNMI